MATQQPGDLEPNGQDGAQEPQRLLQVIVVTGDRAVYDGVADRISVDAWGGRISILPRHAPLLTALEPGELVVTFGEREEAIAIGGGFMEVREDEVIVLADSAERGEEIDIARAEAARRRAQVAMRLHRGLPESAADAQALRRSRARLRVARRVSRRGR